MLTCMGVKLDNLTLWKVKNVKTSDKQHETQHIARNRHTML